MTHLARWMRRWAIGLVCITFIGCATMEVETASSKRFADEQYQSFSWRSEVPTGVPQSMERLYTLSTTVREIVAGALKKRAIATSPLTGTLW